MGKTKGRKKPNGHLKTTIKQKNQNKKPGTTQTRKHLQEFQVTLVMWKYNPNYKIVLLTKINKPDSPEYWN